MTDFTRKFTIVFLPVILIAQFILIVVRESRQNPIVLNSALSSVSSASSTSPTPTVGLPQTVLIPKLKATAAVEAVELDSDGRMATPSNSDHVAWYRLGVKPGQVGNAVIDGHYDDPQGPSVFYNLKNLNPGDSIDVTSSDGRTYHFLVYRVAVFPDASFPLDLVFGSTSETNLNLITCAGVYYPDVKNYDHRLVVFSKLDSVSP